MKPPVSKKGKVLFLTIAFPPNPSAASVVHKHLLTQFDPSSFEVLTTAWPGAKAIAKPEGIKARNIYVSFEFYSRKVHRFFAAFQKYTIPLMLGYHIRRVKPVNIVICYPDLFWLDICSAYLVKKKIPFEIYLHDTVVEGTYASDRKQLAQETQDRVFKHARKIAVMSEGMRSLYRKKYNLESTAWEHIYPESPVKIDVPKERRAHWSGDVYAINNFSVARMNAAFKALNIEFSISSGKSKAQLKGYGIDGDHVQKVFYPERADYLKSLCSATILLVGLNYPEECKVHEDELATIFSTKTPEYLGSGSIIVFHGPAHYFLAQFLTEHNCGVVIDTKDEAVLTSKIADIFDHPEKYSHLPKNALETLPIFSAERVRDKVIATLHD